jgi:hypothetical protein
MRNGDAKTKQITAFGLKSRTMNKESVIELQKIDCNCNDCRYMTRDLDRYAQSVTLHERWQRDYFEAIKQNLIFKSLWWAERGEYSKSDVLKKEAESMVFQFDRKKASINFGKCEKYGGSLVSFIPNTIQLNTQHCFEHRRSGGTDQWIEKLNLIL